VLNARNNTSERIFSTAKIRRFEMKTVIKPLVIATAMSVAGLVSTAQAKEVESDMKMGSGIPGMTGNIGVVSQYIFRGAVENDGAAVQGGLDWAADNGIYVGYWGSNLGYGDDGANGVENDFYAGWGGGDNFTYNIGAIYYYLLNVSDSNVGELYGSLGWGPVTFGAAYALDDASWTNQGDIYWTLGGEGDVLGFTLGAKAGWYTYEQEGEFISSTESSGFRNLDLSISHALGSTGADMGLTYIVGGDDRDGNELDDNMI
jgi:uncharacterized protein (TIGR02001 family)